MGLAVVGTIGILDMAASRRLIDNAAIVARLQATNFRHPPGLLNQLVSAYAAK
jgi:predicted nucleic acid-binding protein